MSGFVVSYNSLENPIGIETVYYGPYGCEVPRYNSLENPIGIETTSARSRFWFRPVSYNSLENPIGIETVSLLGDTKVAPEVTTH